MNQVQASQAWYTSTVPNATLISLNNTLNNQPNNTLGQKKPPATLRTRPISAGSRIGDATSVVINKTREIGIKSNSWVKGTANNNANAAVDSETYRQVNKTSILLIT